MPDYVERLIKEYKELNEKTDKLNKFLRRYRTGEVKELDCPSALLEEQARYMQKYLDILHMRLEIYGVKPEEVKNA